MSLNYRQICPIAKACEVLGERWTILVVRELLMGSTHFRDFQRALPQMSPTLLTKRLTELADCGLVIRKELPQQRRTEYQLTDAGRELKPVVMGLAEWGARWARDQMSDDELNVQSIMYNFTRRVDRAHLPGGQIVIEFVFPSLPRFSRWWIVLEQDGKKELCLDHPSAQVDAQIKSDLRTMAEIWTGDIDVVSAKSSGRLEISGNPVLVRTVHSWLPTGPVSHIRPHPESVRFHKPQESRRRNRRKKSRGALSK
jgi:DNA-binding HxlR family transcriptional regulator